MRQLLVHRHKQVQARTRTKNQLQAMALSQGVQKKWKLWTKLGRAELEQLPLLPYAAERRQRFASGKDVGSYFGLIPREDSSGGKQRLGKISKQGSSFLRFLLVEAGQTAARYDPQLKRFYRRLAMRKNRGVAKVAVARKLATRLYLMLREQWTYPQLCQAVMQVSPSHSVVEPEKPTA